MTRMSTGFLPGGAVGCVVNRVELLKGISEEKFLQNVLDGPLMGGINAKRGSG
jgi:hypothetical protein